MASLEQVILGGGGFCFQLWESKDESGCSSKFNKLMSVYLVHFLRPLVIP
jgi:hypothetical protein